MTEIEKILELIYKYYPLRLSIDDEKYSLSLEYKRRVEKISETRFLACKEWQLLSDSIADECKVEIVESSGTLNDASALYMYTNVLTKKGLYRIHMLRSLLHDSYVILVSGYMSSGSKDEFSGFDVDLLESYPSEISSLCSIFQKHFELALNAKRLELAEFRILVPHIFTFSRKAATVGDCLFSPYINLY